MAEGDKIPRKGGPGITRSDLLVINKIDLAPHVGADLDVMRRDSRRMRGDRPFLLLSLRTGHGVDAITGMGSSAARITAADFVTPPELCDRRLAAEGAGRIGGVRLELAGDATAARLIRCYQQVPLRVLPAFQFGPGQPALVYLLNPTAGLMDGDGQLVCFRAGRGTRTVLVGQSATRIHPCLRGFSTQQWRISVDSGAVLVVLPGPAIPFQDSRYYQRVEIELAADAGLIWGDIWLAGRYAHGATPEQFRFATLDPGIDRSARAGPGVPRSFLLAGTLGPGNGGVALRQRSGLRQPVRYGTGSGARSARSPLGESGALRHRTRRHVRALVGGVGIGDCRDCKERVLSCRASGRRHTEQALVTG